MAQITLNEGLAWLKTTTSSHSIKPSRVWLEIRLLEQAMKATNTMTAIEGYDQGDAVLGEPASIPDVHPHAHIHCRRGHSGRSSRHRPKESGANPRTRG